MTNPFTKPHPNITNITGGGEKTLYDTLLLISQNVYNAFALFGGFTDNASYHELGTDAAAASHTGAITGHLIETHYHNSSRTIGSGGQFRFTGTTTAGKAGNWPNADGYFYDLDGKQFDVAGPIINIKLFGAVGDGSANDTSAQAAAHAFGRKIYYPAGIFTTTAEVVPLDGGGIIGVNPFWKNRTAYTYSAASHTVIKYTGSAGVNTCVVRASNKAVGVAGTDFSAPSTDDLTDVTFRDFHIDANNLADIGMYVYRVGYGSQIDRVTAEQAVKANHIHIGCYGSKFGVIGGFESEDIGACVGFDYFLKPATMTIASPCVVTATRHGFIAGSIIEFATTGTLPTGITAGTDYYVIATGLTANAFQFSTTLGGAAVNTSGTQSGTHTVTAVFGTEITNYAYDATFILSNNGTSNTYVADSATDLDNCGGKFSCGRGSRIAITSESNYGRACVLTGFNSASYTTGPVDYVLQYLEGNADGPYVDYRPGMDGIRLIDGFVHPGNGSSLLPQNIKIEAKTNAGVVTTDQGPTESTEWLVIEHLYGDLSGVGIAINSNTVKYKVRFCQNLFTYSNASPYEGTTAFPDITYPLMSYGGYQFDGSTDYLDGNALTGIADGKKFSLFVHLRFANAASASEDIIGNTGLAFRFFRGSTGNLQVVAENAAGTGILNINATGNPCAAAGTYIFMISGDLATANSGRLFINQVSNYTETTFTDDTIDFTVAEWAIGANVSGTARFTGDIYTVWFTTETNLDFSSSTVRRRFVDVNNIPVFLGRNGELPTGTAPILFHGYDDYTSWPRNRGSATSTWTENGTPGAVGTSLNGQAVPISTIGIPKTVTGDHTLDRTATTIINNRAATNTLTLPGATTNSGRRLRIVTIQAQTVVSVSSNVVPIISGAAGTAILAATDGAWADLESDGTNWLITASYP